MPILIKKLPKTRTSRKPTEGPIYYNYNDPTTPELKAELPTPLLTKLPVQVIGYIGGGQKPESVAGQAASCLITIANGLDYISQFTKTPLKRWAGSQILRVIPRAGHDLNAFYDRNSLQFFYVKDPIQNKFVFTCESVDVVAHELGHAILDSIRPDLWHRPHCEINAFHEAFGDCITILTMLSQDAVLNYLLQKTNGNLSQSNIVTRIAEELGLTLYNLEKDKTGLDSKFLRDIVIPYQYTDPQNLPNVAPDDQLSKESHSFSRIWSSTFYDLIVKIYQKHCAEMAQIDALKKARDVVAYYFLHGVADVPSTSKMFEAIARQMLAVDGVNGRIYRNILLDVFHTHNILRDQVLMLKNWHISDFKKGDRYDNNIVHIKNTKMIKLCDYIGVSAMDYNPLHYIDISLPLDEMHYFDEKGKLNYSLTADFEETVHNTLISVNLLHYNNLIGKNQPFSIENGKLIRNYIDCGCRNRVECDPNSPEYGKGYKPQNNAGCCGKGKARSCDCDPVAPKPKPKLGCYTNVKVGSLTRYRNGGNISRKVC